MAKAYAFLVRCLLSSSIKISTQKNCCVTDHFISDFEHLPLHLQTTNINPVKAHFSLPVKLSESMSLSQILVSYLSLSDFELLEGQYQRGSGLIVCSYHKKIFPRFSFPAFNIDDGPSLFSSLLEIFLEILIFQGRTTRRGSHCSSRSSRAGRRRSRKMENIMRRRMRMGSRRRRRRLQRSGWSGTFSALSEPLGEILINLDHIFCVNNILSRILGVFFACGACLFTIYEEWYDH